MKIKKNRNKKPMDNKDRVLSKFTTGRTKSLKKRKNTLLLEYKLRNKSNKFHDRRIGERNRNMTAEDRVMARFVAQRVRSNKKELFNLGGDDEMLTHRGRSLQEIEKFDNPVIDDSDEEDGNLDAEFVKEAHFGGGLFTKVSEDKSNSHLSTIDKLIAESKKRKAERQQTREETQNLTEELDKDLKELFPLVSDSKRNEEPEVFKSNNESYDVLVRELKFEPVGRPSDKLKPEDQILKEEREKLRKLEDERLQRMKRSAEDYEDGDETEPAAKKHQSADDLDDGFDLDVFNEESSDENDDESVGNEEQGDEEDEEEENEEEEDDNKKHTKCIVPDNLDALEKLLNKCSDVEEKIVKIKEKIKNQQIHTGTSNIEHLKTFLNVLLNYVDKSFKTNPDKELWIFTNKLCPVLFELTQVCGDAAAQTFYNFIKDKHAIFAKQSRLPAAPDTLIFLKLIPVLFPTSDYYHPVATPATVLLCHILSQNSCKNSKYISQGLFLSTVLLEYVSLSKRYSPEVINFLKRILYISTPNTKEVIPPINSENKLLTLSKSQQKAKIVENDLRLNYLNTVNECDISDRLKLKFIFTTLKLLSNFVNHYDNLAGSYAIFSPVLKLLEGLPITMYPACINAEINNLKTSISSILSRSFEYLVAKKKRPKALRLYEPNIRQVIDGRSFRTISQDKLEKEKLVKQYKQEMKGALREIRKDRTFIARVKLTEQAKKDAERKAKVKEILNWGQSQQSDFKRMERQNRYRR